MATAAVDVPDQPHQPLTFAFPKRSFGKKTPVFRSCQPSWFSQWPFLHYDEANDSSLLPYMPDGIQDEAHEDQQR